MSMHGPAPQGAENLKPEATEARVSTAPSTSPLVHRNAYAAALAKNSFHQACNPISDQGRRK